MTRSRPWRALVVAALAVLALAAAAPVRRSRPRPPSPTRAPLPSCAWATSRTSPTPAPSIGVQNGLFAQNLGQTKLATQTFNAGPAETAALLGNSIDIGFIGSGPAINAYKQNPDGIRVISGATSGGAQLVVRPGITSPQQLLGKKIATPQLANTQDISAQEVAQAEQPADRHRAGRRRGRQHRQRPRAGRLQDRPARRRVAARAVRVAVRAPGRGHAADRRADAVAERPVPDDGRHRPHRLRPGPPGHRRGLPQGPRRRRAARHHRPERREGRRQRGARRLGQQAVAAERPGPGRGARSASTPTRSRRSSRSWRRTR